MKTSKVNLWLDDVRPAPIGWTWVKNYEQAVALMQTGMVDQASLDHDLATGHYLNQYGETGVDFKEKTGYDLVCWMEANDCWPKFATVHSLNPYGASRMADILARHYKCQASYLLRPYKRG